jgi:hypothetical protein
VISASRGRLIAVGSIAIGMMRMGEPTAFRGRVVAEADLGPIAGAIVRLPDLALEARTDSAGMFSFTVEPGRHRVVVQHVGFAPYDGSLEIVVGDSAVHQLVIRRVVALDSVRVTAPRVVIADFEERRALGVGHFITRAELAKQENRTTGDIMSRVPGARVRRGNSGAAWIAGARGESRRQYARLDRLDIERRARPACYANVYVDGAVVFSGVDGEPLFDVNTIPPNMIEGIEFYSGASQIPPRFNRTGSECGVLIIWTRR